MIIFKLVVIEIAVEVEVIMRIRNSNRNSTTRTTTNYTTNNNDNNNNNNMFLHYEYYDFYCEMHQTNMFERLRSIAKSEPPQSTATI